MDKLIGESKQFISYLTSIPLDMLFIIFHLAMALDICNIVECYYSLDLYVEIKAMFMQCNKPMPFFRTHWHYHGCILLDILLNVLTIHQPHKL